MEHIDYLQQLITDMASDLDGDIAVGENFTFVYEGQKFAARVYERFNGHVVVAFEVDVCTTRLTRTKQDLINRLNGQLPFTSFRVTKAAGGEHTVTAMHSLSVATIAADQLVQSLDSIAFQVQEQRPVLTRETTSADKVEKLLREEVKKQREVENVHDNVDDELDDLRTSDSGSSASRRAQIGRAHV